jgi:PAS domain S-box-containing protein
MLKSLRYRLLAWFLAFVLLTAALIVPANLIYQSREKSIGLVSQQIGSLHIDFLKDTKAVNDFLTTEPSNTDFFVKGNNPNLSYHINKSAEILINLDKTRNSGLIRDFGISNNLDGLAVNLKHYNVLLDSLVYLVYKRGYRNFGLEGELYNYGSLLESAPGLSSGEIYRLRKIENDYFFNHDTASVAQFSRITARLKTTIAGNRKTAELVDNYEKAFLRLVDLESQTGIRKNIALKAQLNKQSADIENIFARVTAKSITKQEAMLNRLTLFYILSLILILILSVFFSYAASRHIVSHLEALTNYISVLSNSQQDQNHSIDLHNSAREIKQIYREFRHLFSMLKVWEKQRDKAIRSAEDTQQRYQELADMLPQSVFETDAMGNYTYANKAWYKAFGYTIADLNEGLNLIETLIPESAQENLLDQGKIENSTFLAIRKDGRQFPVSVYSDNIVNEGKMDGRRGIIIDITDKINYIKSLQQETSKARTSDELKSSFLANMSHEIRTPMNSIIGFSNLLASEHIPDIQKKDFVHYIRTSSEILLNLVDDIIDIAKIEAGELKIVKKECELYSLGQELLTMSQEVKKKFNKHELELVFRPEPGREELFMKTDPFRLRQIFINLITNAIKFTEKGCVEFGFSVRDERSLEFYVKDTGVGLSRTELDVIFERFKRTRRSEEKNIVGTGLGLAISRNLVQLMGGEMWVDSVQGTGTTFTFTLPYLKITHLPDRDENPGHESTAYNWTGAGILIVEDDPVSYAFLKELFQRTGADLYHAADGLEAVNQFRKIKNIDLVIMDIQLPEMDGFEATRVIRTMNSNIPVIAQTAFAMSDDKDKMKQAGFDDYVSKPIDINQLLAIVHRWLTRSKTRVTTTFIGN